MKQLLTILLMLMVPAAFASTIPVGRSFATTSLKAAVEAAKPGDTILLHAGVYKEGNILIDKSIHLIGVNRPILDGEYKYEIITVTAQNVLIKGLHFRRSGVSSTTDLGSIGIINTRQVSVEDNFIEQAYFAIHVANTSESIISGNTIKGTPKSEQSSGNGIHLWKCDNMVVENNDIQGHRDGIYFEFVTNSVIQQNTSYKNIRYGLHFMFSNNDAYIENTFKENGAGVAVMYSHHVLMHQNNFQHNWGASAYGLLLKEISDSRIYANRFLQNTIAILMEGTNRIEVRKNAFQSNGWALRIQASCSDNTIHHNNFNANTFDIATNGTMMLNRFYNNYWDKYEGYDLDKNGAGDIAYHPVSMYSMVIEQNPNALILLRSFMVSLLDKAEKAIPSLTPENLVDEQPLMKPLSL